MFVVSIQYKHADTEFREKLALQPEEIRELQERLRKEGLEEAVYLHTCNRCELYGVGDHQTALRCLADASGTDPSQLRERALILEKERAAGHAFYVASGMDSMVLGEDEILGQLRDAYEKAKKNGYTGYQLNAVFQAAFSAAKKVKTDTLLSKSSVSVATLAAAEAHRFKEGKKQVLLIGASGDTGRKVMLNLLSYGDCTIIATYRHRHGIPEGVQPVPYEDRYRYIDKADIVVSATKSPHYTLTRFRIQEEGITEKERLFLDLAVPRDIDECVAELPGTKLLTLDAFEEIAREHNAQKEQEAVRAEEILKDCLAELQKDLLFHEQFDVIREMEKEQPAEVMKFIYRFRKQAEPMELRAFLEVLGRMT